MSTFVVRFVGDTTKEYRGHVRHVASGEESVFGSMSELLSFIEEMNASSGLGRRSRKIPEAVESDDIN